MITPTIYYSLYSVDPSWRAEWMPWHQALKMLAEYQHFSKKIIKIYHPLIAGENDSEQDAWDLVWALQDAGLTCEFNLVRYNPASPAQGAEASQKAIDDYLYILQAEGNVTTKVIPRVGPDIKASCGMFVE